VQIRRGVHEIPSIKKYGLSCRSVCKGTRNFYGTVNYEVIPADLLFGSQEGLKKSSSVEIGIIVFYDIVFLSEAEERTKKTCT